MRIIRMRMCIRGFQDWFAHEHDTFAGTVTRLSQKLVASEAACHPGWIIATIDVEKAFLQGMTYAEIQATTGEAGRFVYFTLPLGSAELLRQFPGCEDFDERYRFFLLFDLCRVFLVYACGD